LKLVHQNSFPKLANCPSYFTQLCSFPGGATLEKHADPQKKNRNSRKSCANSRNLLDPFLRSRKEENLYGHCAMNNARRILSKGSKFLRGCGFWSKKLRFRKNFGQNFNAVERVNQYLEMPVETDHNFRIDLTRDKFLVQTLLDTQRIIRHTGLQGQPRAGPTSENYTCIHMTFNRT